MTDLRAITALATRQEFVEAVQHVSTKTGTMLSEDIQRRLFALHTHVMRGPAPDTVPADMHEEQWKVWREVGDQSMSMAMQEYVDLVMRHDPSYLEVDDLCADRAEKQEKELPPGVIDALEAAGVKKAQEASFADGRAAHADIFSAARAGDCLGAFLPSAKDDTDADGLTALIHAVDAEQSEAVAEILQAGANPNVADTQGSTALHYAALLGAEGLVEQLLAAGADPALKDEDGASPADIANAEGHLDVAKRLM